MMYKELLLTFDYELYLGKKSGTPDNCLFKPTEGLMRILRNRSVKAVFFVDTMGLTAFERHECYRGDILKVKQQVRELYEEGHYIFPHVHPHWLDAVYDATSGQFDLSNTARYSLINVDTDLRSVLLEDSVKWLRSIGINHNEWGYRAGGWALQPFEVLRDVFLKLNIRSDFSVLPGYKNLSKDHSFNYTSVRQNRPYFFNNRVEVPESNGLFREFPISMVHAGKLSRGLSDVAAKILWRTGDRGYGDGQSSVTANVKVRSGTAQMITLDLLNAGLMISYKKFLLENEHMHWISHPKMFTNHGLACFDNFLKWANKRFVLETDYRKMNVT